MLVLQKIKYLSSVNQKHVIILNAPTKLHYTVITIYLQSSNLKSRLLQWNRQIKATVLTDDSPSYNFMTQSGCKESKPIGWHQQSALCCTDMSWQTSVSFARIQQIWITQGPRPFLTTEIEKVKTFYSYATKSHCRTQIIQLTYWIYSM